MTFSTLIRRIKLRTFKEELSVTWKTFSENETLLTFEGLQPSSAKRQLQERPDKAVNQSKIQQAVLFLRLLKGVTPIS